MGRLFDHAWTQPSWCCGDVRAIRSIGLGRSAGAVPDGFDVRSAWRIYQRKGIFMTNLACRLRGSFYSADPPRRSSWLVRIEILFFLFSFLSPMAYVVSIFLLLLAKPTKELQKIQPLAEVTQLRKPSAYVFVISSGNKHMKTWQTKMARHC